MNIQEKMMVMYAAEEDGVLNSELEVAALARARVVEAKWQG